MTFNFIHHTPLTFFTITSMVILSIYIKKIRQLVSTFLSFEKKKTLIKDILKENCTLIKDIKYKLYSNQRHIVS